jgi:hypothetical protein
MPEHHVKVGEVDEVERVFDVILPSGDEAVEVVHPGEQALDLPAAAIAAQLAPVLRFPRRRRLGAIISMSYSSASLSSSLSES